jgi:CHAT domain-containing protein
VGLGFAQNAQEKYREAIASYKKAVAAFAALNRREQAARAEVGLAEALSGAGEHGAAIDAAVSARRRVAVGREADDILWRALVAEARALRRLGRRDQALGAAGAAIQAVDRLAEAAANRPSSPVPRDTSAAFATLTVLQAEAGDAAAAFETAERLRVHDLRTILAPVEREIGRGLLVAERYAERAAAGELVSLHAQLSREKALPKPDPARLDRLERSVADAAARRSSQQDRLFARLPELRIWRGMIPPATRNDDLQTLLPGADTVILEFVVDDEDVVVLSVRRGDEGPQIAAHVAALKRRALADRVAALTVPATLRSLEDWRRASSELVKSLPAATLPALASARHAVVIPHEMLWRVPFEALANGDRFVADGTAVVYAASVSTLLRTPPRPQTERPEAYLLAAAAPQVSEGVLQRIRQTAPEWSIRDESTGKRELEEIVGALPESGGVVALSGEAATEAALRERLPDAAAIHIGVPFRVNGASPLFSPAVLAGTAREKTASSADSEDAVLEAREVMNMALRADVAVLSDGAAMSMRDAADDLATVQWAWRAAGVPTLVVARWLADEAASFAIVRELHRRLRAGEAAEASLQAACAAVRAESATRAPFYWAGWLTIGGR